MSMEFVIELFKDPQVGGYVADVVNLPGCMSQGETKEEALENVDKAIKAYLSVVRKTDTRRKPTLTTKRKLQIPRLAI